MNIKKSLKWNISQQEDWHAGFWWIREDQNPESYHFTKARYVDFFLKCLITAIAFEL